MNIITYSKEHESFRQRLRLFLQENVIPYVDEWEKDSIIPIEIWKKMGKQGFLCPMVKKKYGGIEGDFLYSVILAEEITKTNHWGLAANHHSDITKLYIEQYATKRVKERYLPQCVSGDSVAAMAATEPDCGSDLFAIQTSAVEVGDYIVVNGSKTFISNGIWSDFVIIMAREKSDGDMEMPLSLLLIPTDTPGFKKGKPFRKLGWRSQDTSELFFNDCRIPKENRIGKKGSGLSIFMENIQAERLIMSIMSMVLSEMIFKKTMKHCKTKVALGKIPSLSQANEFAMIDMATEIKIGRTFIDNLILEHSKGSNILTEITMAKCWSTEIGNRIISKCLDLIGTEGLLDNNPISRAYRDARILRIAGGATETLKDSMVELIGLREKMSMTRKTRSSDVKEIIDASLDAVSCCLPDELDNNTITSNTSNKVISEKLLSIISEIIEVGKEKIRTHDKFTRIGLDSLLTVRFVWKIREFFDVENITIGDIYEAANIDNLTPIVKELCTSSRRRNRNAIVPKIQRRLNYIEDIKSQ